MELGHQPSGGGSCAAGWGFGVTFSTWARCLKGRSRRSSGGFGSVVPMSSSGTWSVPQLPTCSASPRQNSAKAGSVEASCARSAVCSSSLAASARRILSLSEMAPGSALLVGAWACLLALAPLRMYAGAAAVGCTCASAIAIAVAAARYREVVSADWHASASALRVIQTWGSLPGSRVAHSARSLVTSWGDVAISARRVSRSQGATTTLVRKPPSSSKPLPVASTSPARKHTSLCTPTSVATSAAAATAASRRPLRTWELSRMPNTPLCSGMSARGSPCVIAPVRTGTMITLSWRMDFSCPKLRRGRSPPSPAPRCEEGTVAPRACSTGSRGRGSDGERSVVFASSCWAVGGGG